MMHAWADCMMPSISRGPANGSVKCPDIYDLLKWQKLMHPVRTTGKMKLTSNKVTLLVLL